ncbi:MAG: hypothetical protein JXR73_16735 [Candidatus Omnitrophica bacterium]|nr:hypothetical protein [Candidatus Omnitrophota bacterium]
MKSLRDVYAQKALCQIPRLLSSQDRNRFSPTFGCMNREYWLCRATDFPSSIAQFGVHALSLIYAHRMPDNIYYRHPKVLEWALAGMEYWTKIQHRDGSFDEFYPNERGWAGPTGFLLYVMCDSYRKLEDEIPETLKNTLKKSMHKAARFLAKTDEAGVLANHHAMAILPLVETYDLLDEKDLLPAIQQKLDLFFGYCHEEGWCLEYDGADPGYLSATVSFIAKTRKRYEDERFLPFLKKWVEFSSYFVYPNGHYAGTAGSRQTLHFYPHGYELLSKEIPLAAYVADRMLEGLRDGALVPPEIQGERYYVYRIPELLLSYIDYGERPTTPPPLPCEGPPFRRYFPGARILAQKTDEFYIVVNAAKGGVVKLFELPDGVLKVNNCGVIGQLSNGTTFTSQWIDEEHEVQETPDSLTVRGRCHKIPTKIFTPWKFILFRLIMLLFGGHERLAYHLKGLIRNLLMTGKKPLPIRFERCIRLLKDGIEVSTQIWLEQSVEAAGLQIGDEFPARYVPQSRYFQPQELDVRGRLLSPKELEKLNRTRSLRIKERYAYNNAESVFQVDY